MLTILVEVLLGVFISNLKARDNPYLFCFIKGILIGLAGFILVIVLSFFDEKYSMTFNQWVLFFIAAQLIGLLVSVFFVLIEYLLPDKIKN